MIDNEHIILNDRYKVVIGNRGGVKVYGKVNSFSKDHKKVINVHGKGKDRHVILKPYTNHGSFSYKLSDIKQHVLYGVMLLPCKDDLDRSCYLTSYESIQRLPTISNNSHVDFEEEVLTLYEPIYLTAKSNGFLVGGYNVVREVNGFNVSLGRAGWYKIKDKITIGDLESVDTEELKEIISVLKEELESRLDDE
ncbi:hypothetical protein VP14_158 [Vibrio phage VPMCC14]|nr:hypothetical protein VP14_158 [Vibrio phage VPMCC14]